MFSVILVLFRFTDTQCVSPLEVSGTRGPVRSCSIRFGDGGSRTGREENGQRTSEPVRSEDMYVERSLNVAHLVLSSSLHFSLRTHWAPRDEARDFCWRTRLVRISKRETKRYFSCFVSLFLSPPLRRTAPTNPLGKV